MSLSLSQLEQRLRQCQRDYEAVKVRLQEVGFICEGSLAQLYREWIENRRQLESLIDQMRAVSRQAREHLLSATAAAPRRSKSRPA